MHVHIAAGDRGQAAGARQRQRGGEPPGIIGGTMQLHRQPAAYRKEFAQPRGLLPCGSRGAIHSARQCSSPDSKSDRARRYSPFFERRRPSVISRQICP